MLYLKKGYHLKNWKTVILNLSILILAPITSFSQGHQNWSYNLNIYEVNVRQYTEEGTFAAFEEHLDRLKELGVGILWFMPIYPIGEQNRLGSLGSYYSVKDYYDVNSEFGDLYDFITLVDSIHAKGMYVIMDWVANHTAWDNSLTITYPEWYVTDEYGNFVPPPGTDWTDVIQLDYGQQELRDYMIDAMAFWIYEANIDGFRCDAVSFVPGDFWSDAITQLKDIKPEILMLAEDDGTQYQSLGFDMTYAWGYHGFGNGVLKRIVNGSSNANSLSNYIDYQQNNYSGEHYRMYFTSNHDENSWYGTVFEQFGDAAEPFGVLTSVIHGMPLLYSGQEAGLDERLSFFDKDEIEWQDHPFGDIYGTLFNLKKENKALWNGENGGELQRVSTSDDEDIFAFIREKEDDKLFAIFNLSSDLSDATLLDTLFYGNYTDIFTNDTISFGQLSNVILPGWSYKVYERRGEVTEIDVETVQMKNFILSQNYPNPFNSNTEIQYYLPRATEVKVAVYNSLGEKVKTIFSDYASSGFHAIYWDSKDETCENVSSGLYFYQIIAENRVIVRKMMLLR